MQETVDVLNRGQFIDMLYQLVNTMSDLKQGKIFSIDGTWGYGKTYVLEELERRLSPVVNEDTYDDKFYVFHYNCWQYDYYEEPSVAIISAMLEASENSLEHRINKVAKAGWETAKEILTEVAGEYVKNKIGVNIVEIFQSEKTGIDNQKFKFDQMFAFKKTLDETREKLKRMSEIKTVVIVVDELDRCMPEYAIKVLERLHHLFEGIPNTIVIMAVDSKQLENSVKKIFGKRLKAYKQIGYEIAGGLHNDKQTANAIYDGDNYAENYHKDLLDANKNIIISSPAISGTKVYELINLLKEKQLSGVQITIVTWAPDSYGFGDAAYWMQLHEEMRKAGFYIKTVEESCERFAVIDQEVVWYGNINLLAKDKVDDSIMRVLSKEIASELMEITFGDNG